MSKLYQICASKLALRYRDKIYWYKLPSANLMYEAQLYYEEILDGINWVFSKNELLEALKYEGIWSDKKQNEIDIHIPKVMEELKIDIYLSMKNDRNFIPNLKDKLSKVKKYLMDLLLEKHKYDDYTSEGLAEKEKNIFLIKRCVKNLDILPEHLLSPLYETALSETDIRAIARSQEWGLKWVALKRGISPFGATLSEDQERLIRWTGLYESVLEQQDAPSDEILNDDDAFDGYLASKKDGGLTRTIEDIDARFAGRGGSTEIYIPVNNEAEARRVQLMNTPQALQVIKNRQAQIERMGVVKQGQLQDERIKIEMAINAMET